MVKQHSHPTVDKLSAFSSGQLPVHEAEDVESHIGDCTPCCETLMGLATDDTFVGLLRETRDPINGSTIGISKCTAVDPTFHPRQALDNHPRYEIVELIAQGGMGEVFKAKHRMMDRTVALKLIKGEFTRNPEAVERFHREVKTAAHLSHQNIVTAYDAEQADGVHFLVMEHVDGQNLADLVEQKGSLSVSDACDYAHQVSIGLQHAHEEGMVHRDMKPHNLMLTSEGIVKILDFGLASLSSKSVSSIEGELPEDASLTAAGSIMGTPDFISPEQATDAHKADIRSDIYSLGATLYHLLAGKPPFAEGSVADRLRSHAESEPTPLSQVRDDIPSGLDDVISRMMAKDPSQRFQTPQEVADALAPFVDQHRTKANIRTPANGSWVKRLVALGCASAAIIACGVIYVETDKGTLRIESDDDSVNVVISKTTNSEGGSDLNLSVVDTVTGTQVKRLPSGEYSVSLANKDSDFELSQGGFTLSRGTDVIVKVTRKSVDAQTADVVPALTMPPMAQDAYFTQGISLSNKAAEALQIQADDNPSNLGARLQLLGFYNSKSLTNAGYRKAHLKLVTWIIENYPDSHAAGSSYAHFHQFIDPKGFEAAKNLWLKQANADGSNVNVLRNAASFLTLDDPDAAMELLLKAQAQAPNDADLACQLGGLYDLSVQSLEGDARINQAAKAMAQFEIAVANDDPDYENPYLRGDLARAAFHANQPEKARRYANELLALSTSGKAIHDGNLVLGLVALKEGSVEQAKTYLLASAEVLDGPTITTSGPNMSLAQALLQQGEKEVVLEFFQLVGKFWKDKKLNRWTKQVNQDKIPDFGANLSY